MKKRLRKKLSKAERDDYHRRGWDEHHIFFGKNRKKADEWGCTIWLPHEEHLWMHDRDNERLEQLKVECQQQMEKAGWTREEFMEEFHRNYL